jgi:type I restriction enzyme, S subunit
MTGGPLEEVVAKPQGLTPARAKDGNATRHVFRWVELSEIVDVVTGLVDPREEPYASLPHVAPDVIQRDTGYLMPTKTAAELGVTSGKYYFQQGDILYSKIRPALNKVTVAPFAGTCSADMYVLRPAEDVDKRYLLRCLLTTNLVMQAERLSNRTGIPKLNRDQLKTLTVPLPALPMQHRIANVLDQVDTLRAARRSSLASLSELVIAVFVAHFSQAELAERVPLARALAIPPSYGTMIPPAETGEFVSLRVKNIQNASLDLSDTKYVDLPPKERRRHGVEDGDLLMARAIASLEHLGKCIVVYPGAARWAYDSHLMRIRLDRQVMLPEYLQVWLLTSGGRDAFLHIARRSAVQYNVNTKEIMAFRVPMPPIAKQRAFVDHLRAIEAERRLMSSSLTELDGLFRSLQHRAFDGAL